MNTNQQRGVSLQVRGLRKSFQEQEVLKGIDFDVNAGEINAINLKDSTSKNGKIGGRPYDVLRSANGALPSLDCSNFGCNNGWLEPFLRVVSQALTVRLPRGWVSFLEGNLTPRRGKFSGGLVG